MRSEAGWTDRTRDRWDLVPDDHSWVLQDEDSKKLAIVPARCTFGDVRGVWIGPEERRAMEHAEELIASGWGADRDRPLVMAEEIDLTPSDEEALAAVAARLRRERLEEQAAASRRAELLRTNLRSVRRAVPEDAPAIATLSVELGYPATAEQAGRRLARVLADPEQTVLVAELGGTVVGWVHAAEVRSLESDPWVETRGLVVTAHHRGHGLGRALVEAAAEWGRVRELALLRLRTNVLRTETHKFYERLGFEVRKTQLALARPL